MDKVPSDRSLQNFPQIFCCSISNVFFSLQLLWGGGNRHSVCGVPTGQRPHPPTARPWLALLGKREPPLVGGPKSLHVFHEPHRRADQTVAHLDGRHEPVCLGMEGEALWVPYHRYLTETRVELKNLSVSPKYAEFIIQSWRCSLAQWNLWATRCLGEALTFFCYFIF